MVGMVSTLKPMVGMVATVDHEDQALRTLVIVAPQFTDLLLAADVPNREVDVSVLDGLHVEADGWDGRPDLAKLQFVEDGGLPGGVEANHQDAHLLRTENAPPQLCEGDAHRYSLELARGK